MNTFFNFVKTKKFLMWAGIVVLAILVLGFGYPIYNEWKGRKGVENLANALKQFEIDDYKAAMADTYGGKTPQETLQMYIDAVEKGDYELASKYFIGDRQKEELKSLINAPKENINNILGILRKTEIVDLHEQLSKMYDKENKEYDLSESKEDYIKRLFEVWNYAEKAWMETDVDGYDFSVRFKKYPNGIWKIVDF